MKRLMAALIAVFFLFTGVMPAYAAPNPVAGGPEMISTFGYEPNRHRIGQTMSWWLPIFQDSQAGVSYSQPLMLPGPNGSTRVIFMSGDYLNCYEVPATIGEPVKLLWNPPDRINAGKGASRSHTTYDPKGNLLVTGTVHGWLVYHDPETGKRTYPPTYLGSPEGIVSAPLVLYWQRSRF